MKESDDEDSEEEEVEYETFTETTDNDDNYCIYDPSPRDYSNIIKIKLTTDYEISYRDSDGNVQDYNTSKRIR